MSDMMDKIMAHGQKQVEQRSDLREKVKAQYGENKRITGGNFDKALAVKCINGTFVGRKTENIIAYKGIPFVGKQPVGDLRWKAAVDIVRAGQPIRHMSATTL